MQNNLTPKENILVVFIFKIFKHSYMWNNFKEYVTNPWIICLLLVKMVIINVN